MARHVRPAILGLALLAALSSGIYTPGLTLAEAPKLTVSWGLPMTAPRVPWEGGPAYWNQWAATKPWTNPAFFPIGVWFESVLNQSDVELDKAAGLNTYVELTADSNAGIVRANGMWNVTDTPLPGYGAETTGWLITDEADMLYGPGYDSWNVTDGWNTCIPTQDSGGRCGYTVTAIKKDQRPHDGRPFYVNLGKGVIFWGSTTACAPNTPSPCTPANSETGKFVNGYSQFVSTDNYWYTDNDLCTGGQGGQLMQGQGPVDASGSHSLTNTQCHRASNYGLTIDKMRRLDTSDGYPQPIWAFIEDGHPVTDNSSPTITGPQVQGAVWASLIHGARGIIYFNHSFGGSCLSYHTLREPCGAAVRPAVTAVNAQIRDLAPVLNTQSYRWTFNPYLDTMLKQGPDGAYYIFSIQRTGTSGNYTFTLPAGLDGATAEVLYENRTVPISGKKFTDFFGTENAYHIYRITPPPGAHR